MRLVISSHGLRALSQDFRFPAHAVRIKDFYSVRRGQQSSDGCEAAAALQLISCRAIDERVGAGVQTEEGRIHC